MVIKQNKQQKRWKGKMSRMKQVKLLDIADIIMGQSPKSIFYNFKGEGLPFFQGIAEFGYIYPNVEKWCTKPLKVAKKNDVLMTVRAPVGDLNIAKEECIIGRGLCGLRSKLNNGRFLYYLLKGNNNYITSFGSGAVYEAINKDSVENLVFNIPDELTQQKISSILSAYDDLIENNTRRIQILEEMAQRIYKEWFVDFRFPGHEEIKFIDSELGKIPEGWEVIEVGKKFSTVLGGTPARVKDEYWKGGKIPWINSSKVNELRIIDESEFITELGLQKSSTKMMPKRTTVVAITGATLGQISMLEIEACANQSVIGIYDTKHLFNEYIYFKFCEIIDNVISKAGGGAQQHINKEIINTEKIVIPSRDIILKFNQIILPICELIKNLLLKNKNLHQTRDLLLPKLISGELDVSDLDIKIREEKL